MDKVSSDIIMKHSFVFKNSLYNRFKKKIVMNTQTYNKANITTQLTYNFKEFDISTSEIKLLRYSNYANDFLFFMAGLMKISKI